MRKILVRKSSSLYNFFQTNLISLHVNIELGMEIFDFRKCVKVIWSNQFDYVFISSITLKQKKRLQIKRLSIRFCSTINFYNWWGYFYKKLNQFKIWKKNQVATSKSFGLKISKQAFPLKENNCLESLKPFWWCNFMQKIRSMSSFSSLEHLNNPHFGPILGSICYINPKTRISSKWFYQYPAFLWLQLHAKKKKKKEKKKKKKTEIEYTELQF